MAMAHSMQLDLEDQSDNLKGGTSLVTASNLLCIAMSLYRSPEHCAINRKPHPPYDGCRAADAVEAKTDLRRLLCFELESEN